MLCYSLKIGANRSNEGTVHSAANSGLYPEKSCKSNDVRTCYASAASPNMIFSGVILCSGDNFHLARRPAGM